MLLLEVPALMVQWWYQLLQEATKQRFLWRLGIKNTIQFICCQAILPIWHVMDMEVLYFQLLFFPFPRVCGCTKLGAIFSRLSIGFLASKHQAKRPEFQWFVC
jgi:hypothetical protein